MIIAIDPGANGGYAVQFDDGTVIADKLPATDGDFLYEMRDLWRGASGSPICIVEGQTFFSPGVKKVEGEWKGPRCSPAAIGKFGYSCGFIQGVCQALGFVILNPKPQEWQSVFHLGGRKSCDSRMAWKSKLKGEAQRRYPGIKVTLATADALLMLSWYNETKGTK